MAGCTVVQVNCWSCTKRSLDRSTDARNRSTDALKRATEAKEREVAALVESTAILTKRGLQDLLFDRVEEMDRDRKGDDGMRVTGKEVMDLRMTRNFDGAKGFGPAKKWCLSAMR